MLDIIKNNPFRILGVYANANKKDIVANQGKMKAFLKVGKTVSFPTDFENILPLVERTEADVADSDSKLTLAKEKIKYAQFWFVKFTPIDEIAFNHLLNGNIETAIDMWGKKDNLSSLQNRLVCYLIKGDYTLAFDMAMALYEPIEAAIPQGLFLDNLYAQEFAQLILGEEHVGGQWLDEIFLKTICDEIGATKVLQILPECQLKKQVVDMSVKPLIAEIQSAIKASEQSKGKGSVERYKAGVKLMNDTENLIKELRQILPVSDTQYQMIADKLGLSILQCSIDYFNDSDDDEAAHKTSKLQNYALSIVVGKMAKDRCKENVDILNEIIKKLPPIVVAREHKAIQDALKTFLSQPELIKYSIQLIRACAPLLVSIKEKLGKNHQYYLKISTTIANNALGNIIAEVNKVQKGDFETLKATLISAWHAQLYLDKFDLELEYKNGRYKQSREALYKIIENCKGFEKSYLSYKYKYGCGWCNNLDVSDIDMRSDDEFYATCKNISHYKTYLQKYSQGKHRSEALNKIEVLTYQSIRTIEDCIKFLQDFPNSVYCSKVKENIARLQRIERDLTACNLLSDVITLYTSEKDKGVDINKFSQRAYELAKTEDDFRKIVSIFGAFSFGGKEAHARIDKIEKKRKKSSEIKKKVVKWLWVIGVVLAITLLIYLIWGFGGLAIECCVIAFISGSLAWGGSGVVGIRGDLEGCGMFILFALIAVIFGFSANALFNLATKIEMYEKVVEMPSVDACKDFINEYTNTKEANKVREIWLNVIMQEANEFDYNSNNDNYYFNSSESSDNPILELQDYIRNNQVSPFKEKAQSYIGNICDSLYKIADQISTIDGWKQYQSIVPSDYFKDSEQKISEIENSVWNTEAKAWKQATKENTLSAYNKYKSLYPRGAHIRACEKKIIDLEVSQIYAGDHGSLPQMDRIGYGYGPTSYITVINNTSYTLTLLYSGPDSKRLVIKAGKTSSITLKNGNYRVAASVSASNVRNYVGNEYLEGGDYSVEYYIQHSYSY